MRHNAAKIHLVIGMLMGFAGVALLAAAAHTVSAESVQTPARCCSSTRRS